MSANGAKKAKTMIHIKDYVSVQSDEVFSLRDLPWSECKLPDINGLKTMACLSNGHKLIMVSVRSGDVIAIAASRGINERKWCLCPWLKNPPGEYFNARMACQIVDAWIEEQLAKRKKAGEKLFKISRDGAVIEVDEDKSPTLTLTPSCTPPEGYRMCSREEAVATNGLAWVSPFGGIGWYGIRGHIQTGSFFCTKAPRKFVRCSESDAEKLFSVGAYVEFKFENEWTRKIVQPGIKGCKYRVDKYTIPEGFKLSPVMPTTEPPIGMHWGNHALKEVGLFTENGIAVRLLPAKKSFIEERRREIATEQKLIDAYEDVHEGETEQ